MILLRLQMFGGRGSSSGAGGGGGEGGEGSGSGGSGGSGGGGGGGAALKKKLQNAMDNYSYAEAEKALDEAPVGTKIFDGSTTMLTRAPYEATTYWQASKGASGIRWTLFGDTTNYSSLSSSQVFSRLMRGRRNSKFNLRVE